MRRKIFPDLLIVVGLLALPLLFFFPVTLGGKTLIPADNLYQYEPWLSDRAAVGVPEIPHNALLSDLLLENYQWKSFIRQSLSDGTIPLWQPEQFAGTPFLAAGQHSALYPFSLIYYVLPLPLAYGWFTVSQLWLAGVLMYLFTRGIGVRRIGGVVAAIAYQFSAFMIVSVVFPMMIAGAAWLPFLLLMIEFTIRRRPLRGDRPAVVPWIALGAGGLAMNIFAGHVEITYYTLIVIAYYAAARLIMLWWLSRRDWRRLVRPAASLIGMVALGMGLGAAQFIPLFELGSRSFRQNAADFATVQSYAFPKRHVLKFLMPNVFGSPAQHEYRDVFSGEPVKVDWQRPRNDDSGAFDRVTSTDFGIKNYVEGGAYMGLFVLVLAGIGVLSAWKTSPYLTPAQQKRLSFPSPVSAGEGETSPPAPLSTRREGQGAGLAPQASSAPTQTRIKATARGEILIFALLALVSLTFAFGLPTYALIYYVFPSTDQLHTPFRWVWPLTFCVAVLAAFGADALSRMKHGDSLDRAVRWIAYGLVAFGAAVVGGLLISRAAYGSFEPLVKRIFDGLAKADQAFPTTKAFYSAEFWNVLQFGLLVLASGAVLIAVRRVGLTVRGVPDRKVPDRKVPVWQIAAVGLIVVDLGMAGWGFNSAADPDWLDHTPASLAWLKNKMAAEGPFRYTTYNWGENPLHANSTWRVGLHDARGYDSLIPKQYADYMNLIAPQDGLLNNRIDPILYNNPAALDLAAARSAQCALCGH